MKYRAEVMINSKIVFSNNYNYATHPNQIIRKTHVALKHKQYENYVLYVMNEKGERWVYSIKKNNGKYSARLLKKSDSFITRDAIDMVFSGNINIINAKKI